MTEGLNLTATEMLKGYLLSNLDSDENKRELNDLWKKKVANLKDIGKEEDMEFFKAWLRGKYADSIRLTKKGAENEDFEKIGSRFHSWVREKKNIVGLSGATSFYDFIKIQFDFFSNLYLQITKAAVNLDCNLAHVFYIKTRGFPASFYFLSSCRQSKLTMTKRQYKRKLLSCRDFLRRS